ncbi:MAG: LytTR family transcriptional regulator DNA-binding domain-containing protein [Lachnospiraceae bacterium]|nr:LytTR family transcriptional regulator DNA-binding domain-containing protein [Lachnospiraceae bacterium]
MWGQVQGGQRLKTDIRQIDNGEDELILRYRKLTPDIKRIIELAGGGSSRLVGKKDGNMIVIEKDDIYYIESVDDKTFAYTCNDVIRLDNSLQGVMGILDDIRFFRCSKSMIINIDRVRVLKSLSSNRIDAALENGEHIIISRTYATDFRKLLRGGSSRG